MSLLVEQLSHTYAGSLAAERTILSNISCEMQQGEQLLLRGISGSGKTTLINILAGLLTPSSGRVTLNNQSIYALKEAERDTWRRTHIGYVFQTHHLLPMLTAWENVAMPLAFVGASKQARKEQAMGLLDAVGLANHADHKPHQLSTGQRQRVAIARALVNRPYLVLADEPTASLDVDAAAAILDLLQANCKAQNALLIVASHDPALDARFGRIVDLQYGQWQEVSALVTP